MSYFALYRPYDCQSTVIKPEYIEVRQERSYKYKVKFAGFFNFNTSSVPRQRYLPLALDHISVFNTIPYTIELILSCGLITIGQHELGSGLKWCIWGQFKSDDYVHFYCSGVLEFGETYLYDEIIRGVMDEDITCDRRYRSVLSTKTSKIIETFE